MLSGFFPPKEEQHVSLLVHVFVTKTASFDSSLKL